MQTDERILDWQGGTLSAFNQCANPKACAAPAAWGRQASAPAGWGRAQDPSMNRALIDPGLAERQRFKRMSNSDKLGEAIRHAAGRLPGQARDQALALVDPTNLAIMAGALAIWVGAQATPVGWVVNIAMLGAGVVAAGAQAVEVARELRDFALGVLGADDTTDLRAAGDHLAKAVAMVGVDLVVALLLKKAVVKVREPKVAASTGAEGSQKLLFGKYDPKKTQKQIDSGRVNTTVPAPIDQSRLGPVKASHSAVDPGPLPDNIAATFSGGRYKVVTLKEDTVLRRAGTKNQALGQFFSLDSPKSVLQTRIDKAVLPEWPGGAKSPIDTLFEIKVPKGTQVYVGEVGSQGGVYVGGTEQIVVTKPWLIQGVEVISASPIK